MKDQLFMISKLLHIQDAYKQKVNIARDSFYNLGIELESMTDWAIKNNESCLMQIELYSDQLLVYTSHLVTYMGKQKHCYQLNLGFLTKGNYELVFTNKAIPVCKESDIFLHEVALVSPVLTEEQMLVYEHLPLIYGRNYFTDYDGCYTDTPLAMLYSYEEDKEVIMIEYHCIFSHEDEGTPGKLLLAKWGRLTDIEWCYRIWIDPLSKNVLKRTYQGPDHDERFFEGDFLQTSNRPILQVRTTNGNFDHIIDSSYCFSLVPTILWEQGKHPREWFMRDYSYINYVMVQEAERQLLNHENIHERVYHPTKYMYCFFFLDDKDDDAAIDLFYEKDGKTVSSSYSFHEEIYGFGTYTDEQLSFAIAIEAMPEDIHQMNVRFLNGEHATINKIIFHTLSDSGRFEEAEQTHTMIQLSSANKQRPLKEFLK